ncbi:uncharacterized protein LOC142321944 [Lycorma delicatula]|uniref:uncharacterized protein LOC142321944 n=1 Tax=Lycorma delicatula TaxID=130591 RepID=UPI003F513197
MATTTLTFSRSFKTIKPHVPLIKFRKGGLSDGGQHCTARSVAPSPPSSSGKLQSKVIAKPILEDFQLPQKYRRLPLDQAEIDAINSGGC